jgi:hypothetical protein
LIDWLRAPTTTPPKLLSPKGLLMHGLCTCHTLHRNSWRPTALLAFEQKFAPRTLFWLVCEQRLISHTLHQPAHIFQGAAWSCKMIPLPTIVSFCLPSPWTKKCHRRRENPKGNAPLLVPTWACRLPMRVVGLRNEDLALY